MKNNLPSLFVSGVKAIFTLLWKRTMSFEHDDDDFAPFLAEDVRMNLKQYVQPYFNMVKHSDFPDHALNERHIVDIIGVNKDNDGPRHESFTASVTDEDTVKKHMFILECTASSHPIQPEESLAYCTQFPDSKDVIDTIQEVLREMVSGTQPASTSDPSTNDTSSSNSLSLLTQAIHTAMTSARSSA
jgi:hypothetical protein